MRRRAFLGLVATSSLAAGVVATGNAAASDLVFLARLSGDEEVPVRDTPAGGTAMFRLSPDGTTLSYRVVVHTIDNVVAAHIHLGEAGVNGPVVAFLFGPVPPAGGRTNGVLATGTITAEDLVGLLDGQPLSTLVAAIAAGETYVNVHTNDGDATVNEGPGDFPGGEIRGQIR